MAGLPLILSAIADLIGGLTTDSVTRSRGLRVGRCGIGGAALSGRGTLPDRRGGYRARPLAALLIALAGAADSFLLGAAWGTCLDIAGPHAGLVTGAMNTAGQIGAFLSPIILPYFLTPGAEDWATPLYIAGALYLAGALAGCSSTPAGRSRTHSPSETDWRDTPQAREARAWSKAIEFRRYAITARGTPQPSDRSPPDSPSPCWHTRRCADDKLHPHSEVPAQAPSRSL